MRCVESIMDVPYLLCYHVALHQEFGGVASMNSRIIIYDAISPVALSIEVFLCRRSFLSWCPASTLRTRH
jgi:hypothetical protein